MSATWHPAALGLALSVTALLSGSLPAHAEPTVIRARW